MRLGVHAEESEFYYKCDEKTREGSEQSSITTFYLFLKAGDGCCVETVCWKVRPEAGNWEGLQRPGERQLRLRFIGCQGRRGEMMSLW